MPDWVSMTCVDTLAGAAVRGWGCFCSSVLFQVCGVAAIGFCLGLFFADGPWVLVARRFGAAIYPSTEPRTRKAGPVVAVLPCLAVVRQSRIAHDLFPGQDRPGRPGRTDAKGDWRPISVDETTCVLASTQ